MKTIRFPIVAIEGCPITIGPYTFRNAVTGQIINLSTDFPVVSVVCQIKLRIAATSDEIPGEVISAADGTVKVAAHTFNTDGEWEYQFFVLDSGGNRLPGEPVRFNVNKRLQDAGANEIV